LFVVPVVLLLLFDHSAVLVMLIPVVPPWVLLKNQHQAAAKLTCGVCLQA
jgi:hypothetical protein